MSEKMQEIGGVLEQSVTDTKNNKTKLDEILKKAKEDGRITREEFDELTQKYNQEKIGILDSDGKLSEIKADSKAKLEELFGNLLKDMLQNGFTVNSDRDLKMLSEKGYALPKEVKIGDKLTLENGNLKVLSWYNNNPFNDDRVNLKEWVDGKEDGQRIQVDRKEYSQDIEILTGISKEQKDYDEAEAKLKELKETTPIDENAIKEAEKKFEEDKKNLEKAKIGLEAKEKVGEKKQEVIEAGNNLKNNPTDPKVREAFEKSLHAALTFFANALNKLFHLGIDVEGLFGKEGKQFKEVKNFVDTNNGILNENSAREFLLKVEPSNDIKQIKKNLIVSIRDYYANGKGVDFKGGVFKLENGNVQIEKDQKKLVVIDEKTLELLADGFEGKDKNEQIQNLLKNLNDSTSSETSTESSSSAKQETSSVPTQTPSSDSKEQVPASAQSETKIAEELKDEKVSKEKKPEKTEIPETKLYKIVPGDTLREIAKNHGVTIKELMKANEGKIKDPNRIYSGRTINIPEKKA